MNCHKIQRLIPAYTEGNLPEYTGRNVKDHIISCQECAHVYQELMNTLKLLKPVKEIPEQPFYYTALKQKLKNRVDKQPIHSSALIRKIIQPAIYLASLIVAVYIGILIGSSSGIKVASDYPEQKQDDKDYIQVFSEYNHFDDLGIEPFENLLINDSIPDNKNFN